MTKSHYLKYFMAITLLKVVKGGGRRMPCLIQESIRKDIQSTRPILSHPKDAVNYKFRGGKECAHYQEEPSHQKPKTKKRKIENKCRNSESYYRPHSNSTIRRILNKVQ